MAKVFGQLMEIMGMEMVLKMLQMVMTQVHGFLLTDRRGEPISTPEARQEVCDRVLFSLMRS